MAGAHETLQAFLDAQPACVLVEVIEAKGSTPREQGAWMLVAPEATHGTIGGGQLEWMAIDEARASLASDRDHPSSAYRHLLPVNGEKCEAAALRPAFFSPFTGIRCRQANEGRRDDLGFAVLDVPLGPEIGQCCGGRVKLGVRLVNTELRDALIADARAQDAARPQVLVFGAGHVGQALAASLDLLPLRVTVVETRGGALEGLTGGVETLLTPVPEDAVRAAAPGSAFVILTHDHALDFLLAAEALRRDDGLYVGMIGSKTKRATFRRWFLAEAGGTEEQFARLVCPIGGSAVRDKRPA